MSNCIVTSHKLTSRKLISKGDLSVGRYFSCLLSVLFIFSMPLNVWAEGLPKQLELVTDEFQPYMMNKEGELGLFTDVVVNAYKEAGISVNVTFIPWKRAVLSVKAGKYDGLIGSNINEERQEYMHFSNAVIKAEYGFFSLADRNIQYKTLRDLYVYRVGFLRGGIFTKEFENAYWLEKVETNGHEQAIKLLLAERVDLLISQKLVISYLLRQQGPEQYNAVKFVEPVYYSRDAYTTLSKAKPYGAQAIKAFNQGLKDLVKSGCYLEILAKYQAESASVF